MNRFAWLAVVVALAAVCVIAAACSSDPGYLVVGIVTDVQTPKDVDAVAVLVTSDGVTKYAYLGYPGAAGSGAMALPATLVVEQPRDPASEVRVRLVGFRRGDARIVRDVVTTVPSGRGALLRVPLDYLDDGSAKGALPPPLVQRTTSGPVTASDFDPLAIASTCDFGQRMTSIAGRCASAVVDSSTLPDYDPGTVGAGACFDVPSCFGSATPLAGLDPAACTAPLPQGVDPPANFALATVDGAGVCLDASRCLVPLEASEAWSIAGGVARFSPAVCSRVAGGARLYASAGCAAKGEWAASCPAAGGTDAGVEDADAETPGIPEAGFDCASLLARMLASPIVPPAGYAGVDLSNDGGSNGAFGSGGLSVDGPGLLGCATSVEPSSIDAGLVYLPGYRQATFGTARGDGGGPPLSVAFNQQSHVIYELAVGAGYTGQVLFHSRAGGAYGSHTYVMSVEDPTTGATGVVLRDGAPFGTEWTDDAGTLTAMTWLNELYDGIMATFAPQAASVANCRTTKSSVYFPGSILPQQENDCLVVPDDQAGDAVFGMRPLRFYVLFDVGTNRVKSIYTFWLGGITSCNTPVANQERMVWETMGYRLGYLPDGGARYGYSLGGIYSYPGVVNAAGVTEVEANAVECNGVPTAAPDPGYDMVSWGAHGELAMEYNRASGINYKLFARPGYQADINQIVGTTDTYDITIGALRKNGASIQIDWTSAATALPEATALANAWYSSWCGTPPDTDCVAQGDCTITVDDGAGGSSIVLAPSSAMVDQCIDLEPLGFVFGKGTSTLTQLFIVNPEGK